MMAMFERFMNKGRTEDEPMEKTTFESREEDKNSLPERAVGKIITVNKDPEKGGYGFISSKDIPFTRIFFHWTALVVDTLPFLDLQEKMTVEFKPVKYPDGRVRGIKVRVVNHNNDTDEQG